MPWRARARRAYLVFNTIGNLTTQDEQVACFANAAAHLEPGGVFVVEVGVPDLRRLPPGDDARVFFHAPGYVDYDHCVDSSPNTTGLCDPTVTSRVPTRKTSAKHSAYRPTANTKRGDAGPRPTQVIDLFREHQTPVQADESVETFCRALAFNWAIYGPDAHAKNYSLLLAGPELRLAPLYDIASVVAYPHQYKLDRAMMAMPVNGKYQNNLVNKTDMIRALIDGVTKSVEELPLYLN